MMRYRIIVVMLLSFIAKEISAQAGMNDCRKLLLDYFSKSNTTAKPPKGKVYYLDMQVKNIMKNSNEPSNESEIKITIGNEVYFYQSTQMDLYKDQQDLFVAMHSTRSVYWASPEGYPANEESWNKVFMLRDSLIRESKIVQCKEVADKNTSNLLKVIVLEVPEKRALQTKMEKMEFFLDTEKGYIIKSIVYFNSKNPISSSITTFNEMNFNYKVQLKDVRAMVLNKNAVPVGSYKGYKLIDKRKQVN